MDQRPGSPERLVPRPDAPPGLSLARWQLEKFSDICVPNYRASSPPSSESFQLTRKQGSGKSDKPEQQEGMGTGSRGAAGFTEEKARFFRCEVGMESGGQTVAGRRELTLLACRSWMKLEMGASAKQKGVG